MARQKDGGAGGPKHPILQVSDAAKRGDVGFLIEALADPEMRGSAALRLGDLGARRAVPALIRNLRVRNDLDRNAAVKALARIGDRSAVPALLEVAQEDEAAGVRVTAAEAVARLGDPHGVEMLVRLATDPSPSLAGASRWMDPMRATIPGNVRWTRRWATKRLRELELAEAVPSLQASLSSVGLLHRLRLRRTIRYLRRSKRQID